MSYKNSINPSLNDNSILINLCSKSFNKNTRSFSISTPFICEKNLKETLIDGLLDNYDQKELKLQILLALYNLQVLNLSVEDKIYMGFRKLLNHKKNTITRINNITLYHSGGFEYVIDIEKTKLKRNDSEKIYAISDFIFDNIKIRQLLSDDENNTVIIALVKHAVENNFLHTNVKYSNLKTRDIILYNPKKLLYIYYEDEEGVIRPGIIVEDYLCDLIIIYNIEKKNYEQISYLDIKEIPINLSGFPNHSYLIRIC